MIGYGATIDNLLKASGNVRHIIVAGHGPPESMEVRRYLKRYPDSTLHSFEPQRDFYEACMKQYAGDDRVYMWSQALGSEPGKLTLRVTDRGGWSSVHPFNPEWPYGTRPVRDEYEVRVVTVDEYCAAQNIGCLDLLFLDVQGHEHEVFRGARRMLEQGRIKVCVGEAVFTALHDEIHSFHKAYEILAMENGYRFVGWYSPTQEPWGHVLYSDYVFARPDVMKTTQEKWNARS